MNDEDLMKRLGAIEAQLSRGEGRMSGLDRRFVILEKSFKVNNDLTEELRDAFNYAKKGLKVVGALGGLLIWFVPIAASIVSIYTAAKQFHWWGQ